MPKVVILEDEFSAIVFLTYLAKRYKYKAKYYQTTEELLNDIDVLRDADLFISDFNLPDGTSTAVFQRMKEESINVYTVLNSGNAGAMDELKNAGVADMINATVEKGEGLSTYFERFSKN